MPGQAWHDAVSFVRVFRGRRSRHPCNPCCLGKASPWRRLRLCPPVPMRKIKPDTASTPTTRDGLHAPWGFGPEEAEPLLSQAISPAQPLPLNEHQRKTPSTWTRIPCICPMQFMHRWHSGMRESRIFRFFQPVDPGDFFVTSQKHSIYKRIQRQIPQRLNTILSVTSPLNMFDHRLNTR